MNNKLIFIATILILITVNFTGCNDTNTKNEDDEKFSNWLGITDEIISNLINLTFYDLENKSSEAFIFNLNTFQMRINEYLENIHRFNISEKYFEIRDIYYLGLENISRALKLVKPYLTENESEYLLTLIDEYFSNYFSHREEALSLYIELTGDEW
jgi:hypothetical protein